MASKAKKIWDNYRVIGEVPKSTSIKLVVGAGIRDGVRYINIREFYKRKKDNEWMPGRDGITIPLIIPIKDGMERVNSYSMLAPVLAHAATTLETMELSDEEHAVYYTPKE